MLCSLWHCPKVLYLKITSIERARASSLHTNYFPEANGKEDTEKQVPTVYCRNSKKKWTKLNELQLFVSI